MKKVIFIPLLAVIISFGIFLTADNKSFSKIHSMSASALSGKYDNYPKIKFADKTFILKYSTYSNKSNNYINEYYKPKENKSYWSEKIIIENYIQIKDPLEYGDFILKNDKTLVSLYQRKYHISLIGTNTKYCNGSVKMIKIEPNPKAPGVQVLHYYYKQNPAAKTKSASAKIVQDRYTVNLIQLRTPALYTKEVNIK